MEMLWKRPVDIPFPVVWKRFQGKVLENGHTNSYRIQDVTKDLEEDVIKHMLTYYLVREPVNSSIGLLTDEISKAEYIKIWRNCINQKMALVCLVEEDNGKVQVAGVNMTFVTSKNDPEPKFAGKKLQNLYDLMTDLSVRADLINRHNITEYLTAAGLAVRPMYSGDKVGYELLMARDDLCRKTNIKVTGSVFVGGGHHVALQAGFKVVSTTDVNTYKVNGELVLPRCKPKIIVFAEKVIT